MDMYDLVYNSFWIILYAIILLGVLLGLVSAVIAARRNKAEKQHAFDLTFLHIKMPKDNEIEIKAAEHLFSSLVGLRNLS